MELGGTVAFGIPSPICNRDKRVPHMVPQLKEMS
jgi:hypothetical protein